VYARVRNHEDIGDPQEPARVADSTPGAQISRRRLLQASGAALVSLGVMGVVGKPTGVASAAQPKAARIVIVHGAFADATGWQSVIAALQSDGYSVSGVQNPLQSLSDDIATTKRVIDAEAAKGPVIAVGHSYGGAVITAAAIGNPEVKALVFIAAVAPAAGETVLTPHWNNPSLPLEADAAGFLYLDRTRFRDVFAGDVDRSTASVMAATQKPIFNGIFGEVPVPSPGVPAWETIPRWYLVATEDKTIFPDLQRFFANRMAATTQELATSHVPFVSKPNQVAKFIEGAAEAVTS